MGLQDIHKQREITLDDFVEFIDFERGRWPEEMGVWLDRRYRVMPLDGYDTSHPRVDRFRDKIDTTDPVFNRS